MRKIIQRMLALFLLLFFLPLLSFAQEYFEHVVKKGETLASIASYYNVSEEALKNENPILKSYIYVGMKIRIPKTHQEEESQKADEVTTVSKKGKEVVFGSASDEIKQKEAVAHSLYSQNTSGARKAKEKREKKVIFKGKPLLSVSAFFIPINGGFGVGGELSDILGIPIGLGVGYWKASYDTGPISVSDVEIEGFSTSLNSISVFLTYAQRFYLGGADRFYLTPNSGLELDVPHYSINNSESSNKVTIGLRFNPTAGFQLTEGFSIECGFLGTLYNFKSFGCNMTLGVAYRF